MQYFTQDFLLTTVSSVYKILNQLDIDCFLAMKYGSEEKAKSNEDGCYVLIIASGTESSKPSLIENMRISEPCIESFRFRYFLLEAFLLTEEIINRLGIPIDGNIPKEWMAHEGGIFKNHDDGHSLDGRGIFRKDNIVHEGSFKNGRLDGYGVIKIEGEVIYEGEMANGQYHGNGTLRYDDGRVYVGEFVNGKRHGSGTLTTPFGDYFEGEFSDDYLTPNGKYFTQTGEKCKYAAVSNQSFLLAWITKYRPIILGLLTIVGAICLIIFFPSKHHRTGKAQIVLLFVGIYALLDYKFHKRRLKKEAEYASYFK